MDSTVAFNKEQMLLAFGEPSPPIVRFPHVIFTAESATLRMIMKVVGQSIGIFGDRPPADNTGESYIEPEDGLIIEDFILWELPENQEYIYSHGIYARLDLFTMIINSRTRTELLSKIYLLFEQAANDPLSTFYYYTCIKLIARVIPDLGWAYIPLSDELPFAMFVAKPEMHLLVSRVESVLREANVGCFQIKEADHQKGLESQIR